MRSSPVQISTVPGRSPTCTGPLPTSSGRRSGTLPADEAVPGHLAIIPQVRRQCGPTGQLAQVGPLLGQHLPGHSMASSHAPARWPPRPHPLQSLPVQVGQFPDDAVVKRMLGHMLATHVLHSVLHLALGLGPVRLAPPSLESHPPGEVPASAGSRSAASPRPGPG